MNGEMIIIVNVSFRFFPFSKMRRVCCVCYKNLHLIMKRELQKASFKVITILICPRARK